MSMRMSLLDAVAAAVWKWSTGMLSDSGVTE